MKRRILYINSVSGYGSTGKIINALAQSNHHDSLVCYGRKKASKNQKEIKFTPFISNLFSVAKTILLNQNLNHSPIYTKKLIKIIKEYNPDLIHLHNLHGYYVNVEMLFEFLAEFNKPVVWTLHDCWPLTGYCCYFDYIGCDKYKTLCKDCPHGFSYPFSIAKNNVVKEYQAKKKLFHSVDNLVLVSPSKWLQGCIKDSFLSDIDTRVINNGIEIKQDIVRKKKDKFSILAVANHWTTEKGILELEKMIPLLDEDIKITIVGKMNHKSEIFKKCNLIERTDDYNQLIELYSNHDLFVNLTLQDNYPTVNIESLSCGTPIVTYRTGGSVEVIEDETGVIIDKYDYVTFAKTINSLKQNYYFDNEKIKEISKKYTKEHMVDEYIKLYDELIDQNSLVNKK